LSANGVETEVRARPALPVDLPWLSCNDSDLKVQCCNS
jgi:hypothetical protein